jgi:hypothetical protein
MLEVGGNLLGSGHVCALLAGYASHRYAPVLRASPYARRRPSYHIAAAVVGTLKNMRLSSVGSLRSSSDIASLSLRDLDPSTPAIFFWVSNFYFFFIHFFILFILFLFFLMYIQSIVYTIE